MARKTGNRAIVGFFFFLAILVALAVYLHKQGAFASLQPPLAPAAQADVPSTIRIATWNIRQIGGRSTTDLRMVARIIRDNAFDVVAIQEVFKDGRGVDALLNELGHPWRGTSIGPESRSGERLAFIYRGDRVHEMSPAHELAGATNRVFDRIPYCALLKAGNFDFELVTVHLSWSDAAQRAGEVQTLARLLPETARSGAEKDLILLGDFNEQKSRPNFAVLDAAGWPSVIASPTNLSSKETYDHIAFSRTYTREYANHWGAVNFDEQLFTNDKDAADAVSDHRPVYADFTVTLPDDD